MAFRLARRSGRTDVTAMPLGLDTPGTFGIALFVLGPAFQEAQRQGLDVRAAAHFTWQIGICTLLASGLFKLVVRRGPAGFAGCFRGPACWVRSAPWPWC